MERLPYCCIGKIKVSVAFLLVISIAWVDSQGTYCPPCKEVKGETGSEPYIGVYTLLPGIEPYCDNGCAYQLAGTELRFCFEVQSSVYSTFNCNQTPGVSSNDSTWSIKTIIEENGEIVQQTDTYNDNTGEVTINVPAHGDREQIKVLLDPEGATLVTSKGSKCQIKSLPKDVNPSSMNSSGNAVAERGDDPVTGDTEQVTHAFTIETEDATTLEIEGLSPAVAEECQGKKLVITEEKVVSGEQFDIIKEGGVVDMGPRTLRKKRQISSENCTLTRMCGSRSSSCWRWPYGTAFSMHHLNLDLLCVECCSNGVSTHEYCDCQEITSLEILEQCTLPDNQNCPDGFYYCDGGCHVEIGEPVDMCNDGTCPPSRVSCGDQCIPEEWNTNLYSSYKQWRECDGQCIKGNQPCDGSCIDGYTACGDRCVSDRYMDLYYHQCDGECITRSTPCDGKCGEGYIVCGDICRRENSDWRTCQEENSSRCIYKTEACGGDCPSDRTLCGNSTRCITDNDLSYRECNGICISYSTPCNHICPNGTVLCGDQCIHEQETRWYKECNGKCIYINEPCDGVCPDRMIYCANENDYQEYDNENKYKYNYTESDYEGIGYCRWDDGNKHMCGDECLNKEQKCNGSCAKGWNSCTMNTNTNTNNSTIGSYRDPECYNDESWYRPCDDKCIDKSEHCNEECTEGYYYCAAEETCKVSYQACSGDCQDGWELCPQWSWACYSNTSLVDSQYRLCGDRCIDSVFACDGECQEGMEVCGYRDWDVNQNHDLLCSGSGSTNIPCNGVCLTNGTTCQGECPDGYSVCIDGRTLEDVCYSTTLPSLYDMNNGYCWNTNNY